MLSMTSSSSTLTQVLSANMSMTSLGMMSPSIQSTCSRLASLIIHPQPTGLWLLGQHVSTRKFSSWPRSMCFTSELLHGGKRLQFVLIYFVATSHITSSTIPNCFSVDTQYCPCHRGRYLQVFFIEIYHK